MSTTVASQAELEGFFDEIGHRIEASRSSIPQASHSGRTPEDEVQAFFTSVGELVVVAEARQRAVDRREASRFNVFHLIEPDENRLSDVLADLMDPRGSHGQGNLFLRLLLERVGIEINEMSRNALAVHREAPTHGLLRLRRRIDILISIGDFAVVAIENKIDSLEQAEQVKDYLEHLRLLCQGRTTQSVLIYLTPNGRLPESLSTMELETAQSCGALQCWSYQKELNMWLESCRAACEAQKIQYFLSDFITHIATALLREPGADRGSNE